MADNQKQDLKCPACGKEMKKIFVSEAGINIDICLDGCGGIFFDNRELNKLDCADDNIDEILKAAEGRTFNQVDASEIRTCPICNIPMVKMGAAVGGMEIDVCNVCGAKFLDNNELKVIRNGSSLTDSEAAEVLDSLCEEMYKNDLKDVIGDRSVTNLKSSPRRQFFENLVRNFV